MHEPSEDVPPDVVSTWEPAITPTGLDGAVPIFTTDDARNWVLAYPPRVRRGLEVFEVGNAYFITAAEADHRLSTGSGLSSATGLAPDALVCFVEIYGHIEMLGGVRPGVITSSYRNVDEVFDATTGNILVLRSPGFRHRSHNDPSP